MSKAWDIIKPIKTQGKISKKEKKRKSSLSAFFIIVIFLALVFLLFSANNSITGPKTNQSPSDLPSSAVSPKSVTVKLLNGTGRIEETEKVKNLLSNIGVNLDSSENALNLYEQTIVYYQPEQLELATKISNSLSSYKATIKQFSQSTNYDVIIVIGK